MKKVFFVLVVLGLFLSGVHSSNAFYPDEKSEKGFKVISSYKLKSPKTEINEHVKPEIESKSEYQKTNTPRLKVDITKIRKNANEISLPSDLSEYRSEVSDSEVQLSKFESYCVKKFLLPFQLQRSTEGETKKLKSNKAKCLVQKSSDIIKPENGMELPAIGKNKNFKFRADNQLSAFESSCVDRILGFQISSDVADNLNGDNVMKIDITKSQGKKHLTEKETKQDSNTAKLANSVVLPAIGK